MRTILLGAVLAFCLGNLAGCSGDAPPVPKQNTPAPTPEHSGADKTAPKETGAGRLPKKP